jgi:hypothetical protein
MFRELARNVRVVKRLQGGDKEGGHRATDAENIRLADELAASVKENASLQKLLRQTSGVDKDVSRFLKLLVDHYMSLLQSGEKGKTSMKPSEELLKMLRVAAGRSGDETKEESKEILHNYDGIRSLLGEKQVQYLFDIVSAI